MNTIYEKHVTLYQSQFRPTEKNGASREKLEEYHKLLEIVKENDKKYFKLCSWINYLPEDYLQIKAMSVGYFLLSCLPLLLYSLEYLNESGVYKSIGFAIYLPSLFFLLARYFLEKQKFPMTKGAFFLYIVFWSVCMILGGILHIQILGTELRWIAVYVVGGTLLTLCIRCSQKKKLNKRKNELERRRKEINSSDLNLKKLTEVYFDLRKSSKEALASFEIEHQLSSPLKNYPAPWFSCMRSKGEYSVSGRYVSTDFETPFENSHKVDRKNGYMSITAQNVNSQELSWKNISSTEVQRLFQAEKIFPYFSLGVPYFSDEWKYSLLKHSWDITITKETYTEYTEKEIYTSPEQSKFDFWTSVAEDSILGPSVLMEDILYGSDPKAAMLAEKYLEKKKQTREEIGGIVFEQPKVHKTRKEEHSSGDEIGTLLIKNKEGNVIGVYAGDSYQSLVFTYKQIKEQLDFDITPEMTAYGESQREYLINLYLRG